MRNKEVYKLNFDYYYKVFNGKPEKIKQVCEAILKDFQDNERDLLLAIDANDVSVIRKVLHKMTPIAESLHYESLTNTILGFKEADFEPKAMKVLVTKMHKELLQLYNFLESIE